MASKKLEVLSGMELKELEVPFPAYFHGNAEVVDCLCTV